MKMRVRKKINWMKCMVATGMAVCMVLTTPVSALAGTQAEEGTGTQTISEETAGESILDTGTDSAKKDGETEETGSAEKETQQDSTDSAESSSQIDDTTASESTEQKTESKAAESEDQNQQDSSDAENQADATSAAADAGNQTPTLTLDDAVELAKHDEAKDKLKVDANTRTITVTDGIGLILLSNVNPSEYKGYTINLVTTSGWDLTGTAEIDKKTYSFLGLGDDDNPYEGIFKFDTETSAEKFSITTTKALFNALSMKAQLKQISFSISGTFSTTTKPLLAEKLKNSGDGTKLTSMVVLSDLNSNGIQEAAIGGLIGTMEEGSRAEITFTNNFSNSLKVSGESHTGLFCNTMESGASLTATFKNNDKNPVSVEATASEADAGGFVGHMKADSQLTIAGTSAAQVSSASGNAGGLAGSVTDGKISVQAENGENEADAGKFAFADILTLKAGSDKAAGGLIGAYSVTKGGTDNGTGNSISYDLSEYEFHSITVSGGKNVGGLFGVLKNTSTRSTTVAVSGKTTYAITTNVTSESEVTNLGGLIGAYDTVVSTDRDSVAVMKNTLTIKGTSNAADSEIRAVSTGGSKASTTYGGVIGAVSGSSYVEIENVSASTADMKNSNATSVGGLVGKLNDGFLNVGNVTLTTADDNDLGSTNPKVPANDTDQVEGHGGLVGHLVKGVLRLQGETNLENQKITTAYNHVGQIVGFNENGLIYALGNGNGLDEGGKGWSLTRYSGTDRGGSDIGNWGAVIRLGENLSEGEDGVFTFNEVAHTVTINSSVKNGTEADISGANQFAAYALAFEFSTTDTGKTEALNLKSGVDRDQKQTVRLAGDVNLTNTGIIGIGKDNVEKGKSAHQFKGTLDGSKHTITLDIGATYGKNISGNDLVAGQLYAKRSDQRDTHYSLALIPFAGDVTISELTINGNVICKIPKAVNQEVKDIKYPAFVAGAIGLASGKTEFNHVTVNTKSSVTEEADAKKLLAWQGGFLARCEGSTLTFKDCTWGNTASLADERDTDNHRIGGLAAEVMGDCTVTVRNTTLSGSITSASQSNANVGGLIAVSRGEDSNNKAKPSTIEVSKLSVNGETVTTSSDITSGGLLGYQWKNTNVKFAANAGVTIAGSTLNACTAQFGGLVYQATGYWNATAKDSIVFTTDTDKKANTFTGKSEKENPSGLLVGTGLLTETNADQTKTTSALYLEVGTWGSAADSAYKINEGAVALNIGNSEYFDELAGITRFDDAGNSNAVVSLAVRDSSEKAALIDKDSTTTNTYTGQIEKENYKNTKTRYYYNLDSYRKDKYTTNLKNITSEPDLVLWSAAQYAAENIRTWFREKITSTPDNPFVTSISGNLNLDGYSYYPVTPLTSVHIGSESNTGSDTNLTFAYDAMNTIEGTNKSFSDAEHQHYLMQHGLLYNTSHGVLVNKTSFAGVVGKEELKSEANTDGSDNSTQYNSGALIYGSVIGNPISNIVGITLKNVTLDGIRVTGVEKDNGITYAPLLINRIAKAAKLTVDKLSTSAKYMTGEGNNQKTAYAATSLVGSVGDKTASKLTLSFSNIALDGRVAEDSEKSTSVWNNGTMKVEYHTTHTIFTRAILMEYFMYSSDGSGTYNFNSTDNKVTYGVELTNTGTIGRNPDKQYQYYDVDSYITDEKNKNANEAYVKDRYKDTNFLRYVRVAQNIEKSTYELDINQKSTGLLKGCGTYGDPYIIEDALQLSSLAFYINTPGSISNFQVVFNSKVLESQTQTAENYHTQGNATSATTTGTDITCTWENNEWKSDGATDIIDTAKATSYLLNAYYKIEKDITISAETFSGLGTLKNPFSGVIVGSADNGNSITVSMKGSNGNKDSFGGLIAYSRGSVVKDLTVDYLDAKIQMQAEKLPGTNNKNPFFGGVIGYCMGGDTIIDHVSVQYNENTVSFSGNYEKLIAAGGYVGLVGGATNVTEKSDYEKTGGGVVFRNMDKTTNTFTAVCAEAADEKKTVKMLKEDGTPDGKTTTEGGNYFYRNPYVGRVLDGYACAENCTVNNTDKNYTIPSLHAGTSDLKVSETDGVLNATVASAQGLWLLSAIVNSGAGAMDSTGSYTDVDNKVVDAYQYGKPRTATYEGIGTDAGTDADTRLADEKYWGGNAGSAGSDGAKNRVSYLVKNYTTGTTVARLAGKSSDTKTATNIPNIPVNLTFSVESINMTAYGNGFRGIGCSYGENKVVWNKDCSIPKVYRRNLLINTISGNEKNATKIILDMNQNEYGIEYTDGSWRNQGAGVFVDFHFKDECRVSNLAISGNVKIGLFDIENLKLCSVEESDNKIGVGGFAARTANSTGKVTFHDFSLKNIDVYGGTMTGGAIGYIDGYNNSKRNVTFSNWSIENVNVLKWVQNDGSSGGLVGWNVGYGTLEITRDSNEDVNIKNLKVTTISDRYNTAAAGGLVGACDFSGVSIKNVKANNVTVTGEYVRDIGGLIAGKRNGTGTNINVTSCVLHSIEVSNPKKPTGYTGGIIGYHDSPLAISGVTMERNSKINGQQYTGGFVGQSNANVYIMNCSERDTYVKSDTQNWVGGFIGHLYKTAAFQNCQQENVTVLGRYVGGLIGAADGDIQASNVVFANVVVATKQKQSGSRNAGLVTGSTYINKKNISVKGYNFLAQSCKVGFVDEKEANDLLKADIKAMDTAGFWIGISGPKDNINLTAVSASGTVLPQKDIGTPNGSAIIIYADANADQTYRPTDSTAKPSSSASPWVDVNPKSDVPFADGTVMTGNAAGTGTARAILTELGSESHDSAYYWNVDDRTKTSVAKLLSLTNDAYLTTYRVEENATTTVDENVDFPVLVVNNTADVDGMIWDYIAAMTNMNNGDTAKKQMKDITATSYKWDSNTHNFAPQTNASLSVSSGKKLSITPNAYDNQCSQFTLLDVTYIDPTDTTSTTNPHVFHLYIPVLVKKVLYINFKTRFLAGTDYCASDYPMTDISRNHYATADFNEPLTALIEYSYEKETDWQSMLDNGENLLWYYDKVLDLASGSSGNTQKLLPEGTRLTLVDRQTKQYYIYTIDGNKDLHRFNLANMTVPGSTGQGQTPQKFAPVYICDLLGLKADLVLELEDGTTYYVKETDSSKATVRIGADYYRKAEEKDKDAEKYRMTIPETDTSLNSQEWKEEYYLTIQIPKTDGVSIVNNRLYAATMSRKEGTLPAVIKSDKDADSSAYVVYNGVQQTFSISTSRIHNGSPMGDTAMENGDGIKIKLTGKLWLTEAGQAQFKSLGPSEVYHEFDISLKKYLENAAGINGVIGTENIQYIYQLSKSDGTEIHSEKGKNSNAAGLETMSLRYGSSELKSALEKADSEKNAITVTAEITLTYDGVDDFPVRGTADTDSSGTSVVGVSRIANTSTQLPITENKKAEEDRNRYYITNPSKAILRYSSVDGTGIGDTTQQLGVNPSDAAKNRSDMIYTRADYDYSNVDTETLSRAAAIRYKMELFQKNENGTYDETNPLEIGSYLQNIVKDSKSDDISGNGDKAYRWKNDFVSDDTKHQFAQFTFTPLTGEKFEQNSYTYANYRVRLTAVLLDKNGSELDDTKATDYIIYTNARIYQDMIDND